MELKLPVSDAAPYPALRIQGPSPRVRAGYAGEYRKLPFGNDGHCPVSVIDSVLTRERWPKIAEYFHHIMIVEMRHLELFCQAAQLLGGRPPALSNAGGASYWNASCCSYRKDLPALLNAAAAGESQTIAQYRRQAEQLPDPNICELLKRILLDEEKHLVIFRRLYQEYCGPGRKTKKEGPRWTPLSARPFLLGKFCPFQKPAERLFSRVGLPQPVCPAPHGHSPLHFSGIAAPLRRNALTAG